MLQLLVGILVLILSVASWAQLNLSPRGLRTALLGNNGIALTADTSAGVLNPSSIVGLKDSRFSASSSVLQFTKLSFTSDTQVVDRSQEAQFGLTSGYISSFFKLGQLDAGFYVVEDTNFNFSKYFEYSFQPPATTNGSSQLELTYKSNRLGFILGTEWNNWSFSINPLVYIYDRKSTNLTKLQSGADTQISFNDLKSQSIIFSFRMGTIFQTEKVNYGFYIEPEGLLLSNSQTRYTAEVTTSGSVSDKTNSNTSNETTPPHIGFGLQFKNLNHGFWVLDFWSWSSISYEDKSDTDINYEQFTQKVTRMGIGYQQYMKEDSAYGGGLQFSKLESPNDGQNYNLVYFNLGRQQKISFLNTFINLFYSNYSSQSDEGSRLSNAGLSIGTEYSY